MANVQVLDGKPYKSLDDVLYMCRELLEDDDFPTVKKWRAAGGKVDRKRSCRERV